MLSNSEEQTINVGKKIASRLKGGDIVCLHGELGAGKTRLVKGIAHSLGVKDDIVSPTFTLMNIYDIKTLKDKNIKTFVHIDTYRLTNEKELADIGVEDYLGYPETVCVIEWPEQMTSLLENKRLVDVAIEHAGENKRRITIT